MKETRFSYCLVWALLSIVLYVPASHAGDKFIIKPMIIASYGMDSNFYKTSANERAVSTLTMSPGVEFGYQTEKSRVAANGTLNLVYYDDLDSVPAAMTASDNNDYTGHRITLFADTRLFTRISLGVNDTWINTRNPTERDRFDNFINVDEYTINILQPWLKYKITDRISTGLAYAATSIDYDALDQEDSIHTGGKINLYYEVSRLTVVDLEYSIQQMDYDLTSSDYDSSEYRVNFSSKFKYFEFTGGLGYHKRNFDQTGLADIDTLSWDFSVKGRNPPEPGEKPRSYIDLGFAQNFNNTGNGDEYYVANRVSLTLGHLFMEKIDVKMNAYYQKSNYEDSAVDRGDDTYFLAADIFYFAKEWLTLNLKSGIETRNSSIAVNDYDNTFVIFRIIFNYNFGSR